MTEFDPSMLPPRPQIVPPELRQLSVDNTASDWSTRIPASQVGYLIAAFVQWLSHPRMGISVEVETRDDGWTINVKLPRRSNE